MTCTYIIKTTNNELYCGKAIDFDKRLKQHLEEKTPHWFSFNNRKKILKIYKFNGDFEKNIKEFGVKSFVDFIALNNEVSAP
jgi:predicted GIY-YIG superfamily endonuclease